MDKTNERASLYFFKTARSSASLLILMGIALVLFALSNKMEGYWIFIAVGIIMFILGLIMTFRVNVAKVKGREIDEIAQGMAESTDLDKRALRELDLFEQDIEEMDQVVLKGYCTVPIETAPLYRFDEEDGRARSSTYQLSKVYVDDDRMYAYTLARSLVDSERIDGAYSWTYASIKDIAIEKLIKECMLSPKKDGPTKEGYFDALVVYRKRGERVKFAVDESCMEDAKDIVEYVKGKINGHN